MYVNIFVNICIYIYICICIYICAYIYLFIYIYIYVYVQGYIYIYTYYVHKLFYKTFVLFYSVLVRSVASICESKVPTVGFQGQWWLLPCQVKMRSHWAKVGGPLGGPLLWPSGSQCPLCPVRPFWPRPGDFVSRAKHSTKLVSRSVKISRSIFHIVDKCRQAQVS